MKLNYPQKQYFAVYFRQGNYHYFPCQTIDEGMRLLNEQTHQAGELPIGVFDPVNDAFKWHPVKLVQINQFSMEHHDRLIDHILMLCKRLTTLA